MSTIRNPIGPQPPKVYWRRRLMVALGLLVVIFVIVLIVVRPGAGDEGAPPVDTSAAPDASAPADDAAAEEPDTADDGMCRPSNVTLEAVPDAEAYAAGVNPQISMRITNVGSTPCILDVTATKQVFEIGSANEPYWLSSDCQAEATEAMVTLEPNVPQSTTPIPWDRTRSLPCDTSTQPVPAADATYYLQVRLGELESAKVNFRLL